MSEALAVRIMQAMLAISFVALIVWTLVEYLAPPTMLALLAGAAFCR
ncbi:hypothetical protein M3I54_09865 [Paraburkholderia sp. CNPSo 3274]|nr:hypothetical protein [Paraburkholderia sp. CNPSo 3274]MCP3707284.1 hypothetical protein [Paraburkholderia sp. CNPSo 3274]